MYLPLRFGKCNLEMPTYDKVYDKIKLQIGQVKQVENSFYEFQKMNLGCFQEIKIFYASYIVINFFISIIRVIYTKIKVNRFKKRHEQIKQDLKKAADQKSKVHKQLKKKQLNFMKSQILKKGSSNNFQSSIEFKQSTNNFSENTSNVKLNKFDTKNSIRTNISQLLSMRDNSASELNESKQMRKIIPKLNQVEDKAFDHDMFKQYFHLNQFIESEIYLENLDQSDDLDSSVRNFNEVFVMYMALSMFGMLFPGSYFLYYFVLILEVYIDRETYLFVSRRPSPKEKNSIGFFKYFLVICPSMSIIIISFYLSFSLLRITLNINYLYMTFLLVFVCGILIFQLVYQINPKGSEKMRHLIERQKYICKFV